MSDRYHKAAIDGYLELLKEATRRDLNTPDEDGMTPTILAAYHSHLEALELICSRGGDPDKCDIWGNTPLHHAAANGHLHCVTFLVNFGANIFSLDNDFHSAMDLAATKNRMDCVGILDAAAGKQQLINPKKVAKLKEQAEKDAEKRVKECEKLKKRHQHKMNKKYDREINESRYESISSTSRSTLSNYISSDISGSLTARLKGTFQRKLGNKYKNTIERKKKEEKDFEAPTSVMDMSNEKEEHSSFESGDLSPDHFSQNPIFKCPGMVFRRTFALGTNADLDELSDEEIEEIDLRIRNELFQPEVSGNSGEVNQENDPDLPWNEEEIGLEDDEPETTPLEVFLATQKLVEFIPIFNREKIDLDALMLCNDEDLKGIHMQLGPRKKLLEATEKRKQVLKAPGRVLDTVM
uniref:Ankyrin repeat and sterile alpha motif domain containing 4B n=1 Tax=Latimeria chalumnae TaxID=7897 RepID=H3AM75_LATCH